jgi:hypothetical protein
MTESWEDRARTIMDLYHPSDHGNALQLIDEHGHEFRRIADMRRWFVWDGMRWAMDHEDRAVRAAARELAKQLPEVSKEERSFKRNSMSATGISGAARVAETDRRVSILAAELDRHPELINTPSGVVDLRTGVVRPHDMSGWSPSGFDDRCHSYFYTFACRVPLVAPPHSVGLGVDLGPRRRELGVARVAPYSVVSEPTLLTTRTARSSWNPPLTLTMASRRASQMSTAVTSSWMLARPSLLMTTAG